MPKSLIKLTSSKEIEELGLRQAGKPRASWVGVDSMCDRNPGYHVNEVHENAIRFERDPDTVEEYVKATHFMHHKTRDVGRPGEKESSYAHAFVFYMPC